MRHRTSPSWAMLGLSLAAACAPTGPRVGASAPPIQFQDRLLSERYVRLRACVLERTRGWEHVAPTGDGILSERWCRSARPGEGCPTAWDADGTVDLYELRSRTGGDEERLELHARRRRTQTGMKVEVTLQPWTGGFGLGVSSSDGTIVLQATHAVSTNLDLAIEPLPPHSDRNSVRHLDLNIAPYAGTAVQLREAALSALQRTREAAQEIARRPELTTCIDPDRPERFEHRGDRDPPGLFDTCDERQRPVTPAERHQLGEDVERQLVPAENFVRTHAEEIRDSLDETFPVSQCWLP